MHKTEEVVELHTRQTWFECPICESVHTVSERTGDEPGQRVGNAQRFSAALDGPHSY